MSCNFISTNQELRTGDYIKSLNNEYYAILQGDGNLVVHKRDQPWQVWATDTAGSSAVRLVLQSDGNMIMFDSDKKVVWQSNTTVEPFSSRMRLTITNEGVLLLDNDGHTLWKSGY